MNKKVQYAPLSSGKKFTAEFNGQECRVDDGARVWNFPVTIDGPHFQLRGESEQEAELIALEYLFGHLPELQTATFSAPIFGKSTCTREEFFQLKSPWHWMPENTVTPERWVTTGERRHPERPPLRLGTQYKRYIPQIERTLSFRVAEVARDLEVFHGWHNQPRVFDFWELNQPKAELAEYLTKGLADPHQTPFILELDGKPVGYFELYWVAEDRLGPYYESQPFDRGFHFLIGEESELGFKNTDAILKSVCHFLFIDEPRTRFVMAEPRYDNVRVLKYVETFKAWRKVKEFDFPHKRAALLECNREKFFAGNFL